MTFANTILRACARRQAARARRTLLGLVVLMLLLCLGAAPSFARSSRCAVACTGQLAVSLSGEAAGEEGEEGEGEEAVEEEEGEEEGATSAEEEEASAEAEAEEEAEGRHRGKRHGARKRVSGGALVLSKLQLTHKSSVSLKHSPLASQVEFSFRLVKSMKVQVTFVKQGKPHAHKHWTAIPADSLTISATKGSSRHHLVGRNRLSAGRYRLTLSPAHGKPRSIYVSVRG
ncbi:MAG: hypothetical protein ACTHM1_12130 [Solirubrobacteraceae bacterium]